MICDSLSIVVKKSPEMIMHRKSEEQKRQILTFQNVPYIFSQPLSHSPTYLATAAVFSM